MAIYLIKRRFYSGVVRNPYKERKDLDDVKDASKINENIDTPELNKQIDKLKKSPIYENLDKSKDIQEIASKAISKLNRDKSVKNQNININKTTNINNPAKEKSAELDAQVKMSKMRQQMNDSNSVNEKLIEIQKTNPLKPLSMNGRN